jgi:hypothetical protein
VGPRRTTGHGPPSDAMASLRDREEFSTILG